MMAPPVNCVPQVESREECQRLAQIPNRFNMGKECVIIIIIIILLLLLCLTFSDSLRR